MPLTKCPHCGGTGGWKTIYYQKNELYGKWKYGPRAKREMGEFKREKIVTCLDCGKEVDKEELK